MSLKIEKKSFFFLLQMIILCEPQFFYYNYYLDLIFKILKILVYIYAIYLMVWKYKFKFSSTFRWLLLYEGMLFISTVCNGLTLYYWLMHGMNFISVALFVELEMRRSKEKALKMIVLVFSIFLVINILTRIFDWSVVVNNTPFYFLGLRTRTTDTVLVVLIAIMLFAVDRKKTLSTLLVIGILFTSVLVCNVSTGILGLLLFFALFIAIKLNLFRRIMKNWKTLIVVLAIVVIGVVVFRVQKYFEPIFMLMFNKGADMSSRIFIWDSSIEVFLESEKSIIIGHGVSDLGEWVPFGNRMFQAHDQYLQVLLDGGILAMIPFVGMFMSIIRLCTNNYRNKAGKIGICFCLTYGVIMITEIYSYYPQFFLAFFILSNYEYLEIKSKKEKERVLT